MWLIWAQSVQYIVYSLVTNMGTKCIQYIVMNDLYGHKVYVDMTDMGTKCT